MFFGEEESEFQNLPPEMIVEVLSFVKLLDKKESRLVCRQWRWILDHPWSGLLCFKQNFWKMNKESPQSLLNSQLHIDNLDIRDIKMTWPIMTYSRNKFPPIQKIRLGPSNCEQTVITVLQYGCAETESLTLYRLSFGHVRSDILSRMLSGVRWNQLTELSVHVMPNISETVSERYRWGETVLNSHRSHASGIERIFKKATIPTIRILRLDVLSYEQNVISAGLKKIMSEFMTFIERHSKTLKGLGLCFYFLSDRDKALYDFPNIPSPLFSTEQQETIARNLKLESLEIKASIFDALVHLVPPSLMEADKLTKLSWYPLCKPDYTFIRRLMAPPGTLNPVQLLIQRNQNSLINVTTALAQGQIVGDPFQISWLESCRALRELTVHNCYKIVNVQVRLPTVTKLDVGTYVFSTDPDGDLSTWIVRSFPNLQIIQISVYLEGRNQNWMIDWLQNVLLLPSLRKIMFSALCESPHLFTQTLLAQFCSDKPRLILKTRQRKRLDQDRVYKDELCACLIKIITPN